MPRVGAEHSRTRGQQRLKSSKKVRVAEAKLGENRRDLAMEVTAGRVTHIVAWTSDKKRMVGYILEVELKGFTSILSADCEEKESFKGLGMWL